VKMVVDLTSNKKLKQTTSKTQTNNIKKINNQLYTISRKNKNDPHKQNHNFIQIFIISSKNKNDPDKKSQLYSIFHHFKQKQKQPT